MNESSAGDGGDDAVKNDNCVNQSYGTDDKVVVASKESNLKITQTDESVLDVLNDDLINKVREKITRKETQILLVFFLM